MQVDKGHALRIAQRDASSVYRELDRYEVSIELEEGDWRVDYELKDRAAQGGGPHYVISADTGEILSRRYEQ